jgi:hypothetical protein
MKRTGALSCLLLASLVLAAQVQAAPPTTAPTPPKPAVSAPVPVTPLPTPAAEPAFQPKFVADLFSIYIGPSITGLGSPYQVDQYGFDMEDPGDRVGFENYLTLGYKATPEITIAGVAQFFYTPMQGGDYTIRDPYLKVSHSGVYKTDDFKIWGNARLYFGVSEASRNAGMVAGLRVDPKFRYAFPKTPWSVDLYSSVRFNFHGLYGDGKQLDLYLSPAVDYQLLPNLVFSACLETYGRHDVEGSPPFVQANAPADIQIGPSWDITPWLNFNPYVQIYPGYFSWSSTSIGAYIDIVFL